MLKLFLLITIIPVVLLGNHCIIRQDEYYSSFDGWKLDSTITFSDSESRTVTYYKQLSVDTTIYLWYLVDGKDTLSKNSGKIFFSPNKQVRHRVYNNWHLTEYFDLDDRMDSSKLVSPDSLVFNKTWCINSNNTSICKNDFQSNLSIDSVVFTDFGKISFSNSIDTILNPKHIKMDTCIATEIACKCKSYTNYVSNSKMDSIYNLSGSRTYYYWSKSPISNAMMHSKYFNKLPLKHDYSINGQQTNLKYSYRYISGMLSLKHILEIPQKE